MKKLVFLTMLITIVYSCNNDNLESNQEEDGAKLEKMHSEIITLSLANSQSCTNSEDWDFTGIGSRACGGFQAYIIYSKKIDTTQFLKKVKDYTDAQAAYNKKWGIASVCSVEIPPKKIECVDGKPKAVYN
ncbi:hypothetical protein ACFSJW_05160 [Flavobacterium artemisiae]|uniref:Lipoprotein n=1 Tax=Flavobacterium artemisiae TaxID=2126556 RepID=A0ABW4HMA7_9FLAO